MLINSTLLSDPRKRAVTGPKHKTKFDFSSITCRRPGIVVEGAGRWGAGLLLAQVRRLRRERWMPHTDRHHRGPQGPTGQLRPGSSSTSSAVPTPSLPAQKALAWAPLPGDWLEATGLSWPTSWKETKPSRVRK